MEEKLCPLWYFSAIFAPDHLRGQTLAGPRSFAFKEGAVQELYGYAGNMLSSVAPFFHSSENCCLAFLKHVLFNSSVFRARGTPVVQCIYLRRWALRPNMESTSSLLMFCMMCVCVWVRACVRACVRGWVGGWVGGCVCVCLLSFVAFCLDVRTLTFCQLMGFPLNH